MLMSSINTYLKKKDIDITVFTPKLPANAPEKEILHSNVKIIRFPAFEIIPNYPVPKFWSITFWKLFNGLFKDSFDTVISRTRFFLTSLLAFFFSKIKNIKWIHIEHGSDFVQLSSKFNSFVAKLYDYTFGKLVFKYSDINISISKTVQKFVHRFDNRHSPVVYRGLNFTSLDAIPKDIVIREQYSNKIIITFVGRLYKWKGVENSIKAIKRLPAHLKKKIIFLIIGYGEDFEYLKDLSKTEVCIKMIGSVSHKKAIGLLKASDIYIHSAHPGGGLSTSLLEAMYCKNAIIATKNEGANEIIHDKNGIIIDSSDECLINESLLKLINDNKYLLLSRESVKTITNKINWNTSINEYLKLLKI